MAAPTKRASTSTYTGSGVTSPSITLPGSLVAGDQGLLFMAGPSDAGSVTVPGWTPVIVPGGTSVMYGVWKRVYQAGDSSPTVNMTAAGASTFLGAIWFSGCSGVDVIGPTPPDSITSSTTSPIASITTTTPDNVIVLTGYHRASTGASTFTAAPDASQDELHLGSASQVLGYLGHFTKTTAGATNVQTFTANVAASRFSGQQIALLGPHTNPTSDPGSDYTLGVVGTPFTRTGSSAAFGGTITAHEWTLRSYPENTTDRPSTSPTLTGATTSTIGFTPNAQGRYVLGYRVQDSTGAWSAATSAAAPTMTVYVAGTKIIPYAEYSNAGGWTLTGSAVDSAAALRDSDLTTYTQSNAATTDPSARVWILDPLQSGATSFTLNPWWWLNTAGSGTPHVYLYDTDGTLRKTWTGTAPGTSVPVIGTPSASLTLTSGEIATIVDWKALRVGIDWDI